MTKRLQMQSIMNKFTRLTSPIFSRFPSENEYFLLGSGETEIALR